MNFKIKFDKANIVIIISVILISWQNLNMEYWKKPNQIICWDIISYYAYLPATFIYHDLSLKFRDKEPEKLGDRFWPKYTPDGRYVIMTTMGMSILYLPFFYMGHISAHLLQFPTDGFSEPYKFFLQFSALFYLVIGLFFLKKILQRYFNPNTIFITLIAIVFGTTLFAYSSFASPMPHSYNFSLIAAFFYYVLKWHDNPILKTSIILGLLCGIIVLIRPTNIVVLIIFIFYNVTSFESFIAKIKLLSSKYYLVLYMILAYLVVWLPQLIYWKYATGKWFYYSYDNEKLYLTNPHIIQGLFSYRKGWFVYTPIMLLAVICIFLLKDRLKPLLIPIALFTVVNVYVILSWWCWFYGGCFGQRAMVDSYALLAIPLAAFIEKSSFVNKVTKYFSLTLIILLILYEVFLTIKYRFNSLHGTNMTKEAFWDSFWRIKPSAKFYSLLREPDWNEGFYGGKTDYLYVNKQPRINSMHNFFYKFTFDTLTFDNRYFMSYPVGLLAGNSRTQTNKFSRSGKYSIKLEDYNQTSGNFLITDYKPGEKIHISVWVYNQNDSAFIEVKGNNPEEFYKIGNNIIKKESRGWKQIALEFVTPQNNNVYILYVNLVIKGKEIVYFDDLVVYSVTN